VTLLQGDEALSALRGRLTGEPREIDLARLRSPRDEPGLAERRPADSGRIALRVRGTTWADLEAEAIRMADKVFGSGGWVVLSPLDAETKRVEPGDDDVVLTATIVMAPQHG